MFSLSTLLELGGFAGLIVTLALWAGAGVACTVAFALIMLVGHLAGDR